MAVATLEADEATALSGLVCFVQFMGIPLKKLLAGVIVVIFGHFASSDFKVWLLSCAGIFANVSLISLKPLSH